METDKAKIKIWQDKIVFLKLNCGSMYTGKVLAEDEHTLLIRDKFDKLVQVSKSDIKFIKQDDKK